MNGSTKPSCLLSIAKLLIMKLVFFLLAATCMYYAGAQTPQPNPCSTNPIYREFDFWLGEWEVYGIKGKKAGDSKIEMILDSCIILENWTSANGGYAGKSFNTYNSATKQWQQTWVDNKGGSTEFLRGNGDKDKMTFYADNVKDSA